jgi:hypothetical protein
VEDEDMDSEDEGDEMDEDDVEEEEVCSPPRFIAWRG